MRIIGFDPGIDRCGYGVIEIIARKPNYLASGKIMSQPTQSLARKLAYIQKSVYELADKYSVSSCAIEDLFAGPNPRGTLRLGMAHGVILAALGNRQLTPALYSPAVVKKTIAGNGRATKEAIERMVQRHLAITGSFNPDSSDALAIALCHFYMVREALAGL